MFFFFFLVQLEDKSLEMLNLPFQVGPRGRKNGY